MKSLLLTILLVLLALGLGGQRSPTPNTTVTYEESFENIANPERGLPTRIDPPWPDLDWYQAEYGQLPPPEVTQACFGSEGAPPGNRSLCWEEVPWEFCETDEADYRYTAWTDALDQAELKQQRAQGATLVMVRYHLADFRRRNLSSAFLKRLARDFNTARQAGVKVVPRFAYNYPKGGPDTSVDWVLTHLDQLKPVFQEHYDVIAFADLELIGCWGEGHTTANELMDASQGYRRLNSATIAILEKFFEVLPKERMVAVRYPEYKFQYFNGLQQDPIQENKPIAPITPKNAYDGSIRSRWGQHEKREGHRGAKASLAMGNHR